MYRMAARLLDVHPNTIHHWEATSKLRCEWTPSGKERRIPESEIRRLMGLSENADVVAYKGRVSGHGQKDDPSILPSVAGQALERQVKNLEAEFAGRFAEVHTFTDMGSGLNPRRKGLWQTPDLVRARQVRAIAVTYQDSLTRFGFEYLEEFLAAYGVEILVLHPDDDDQGPEQEWVADMLALVTAFAGRLYGRRSPEFKELTKCLKKAVH